MYKPNRKKVVLCINRKVMYNIYDRQFLEFML